MSIVKSVFNSVGYNKSYGIDRMAAARVAESADPSYLTYGTVSIFQDDFLSLEHETLVDGTVGFMRALQQISLIKGVDVSIMSATDSSSGKFNVNLYDSNTAQAVVLATLVEDVESDHAPHYKFMESFSITAPQTSFVGITPSEGIHVADVTFRVMVEYASAV